MRRNPVPHTSQLSKHGTMVWMDNDKIWNWWTNYIRFWQDWWWTFATLFQDNEYPSKILCFFCADDNPDVYAIVQPCEKRNQELDSILTQWWRKEWHWIFVAHYQPVLQAVSVDSFGQLVLVVEDDPILQESMHCDDLLEGCTLILPREDFWPNQFQLIFE